MAGVRIVRSRTPANVTELQEAGERLRQARVARDAADEHYHSVQADFCTLLASRGLKSSTLELEDGVRYRMTMTQSERLEVNEPGLRKAMGAPQFDRLCDLKLNRQKLEVAIAEGRVDPMVVSAHTTRKANSPYIRMSALTERTPQTDQEL